MASQVGKSNEMAEAMDYDDRMLEIPEGVDTLEAYLREGFWPHYINVFSDFGVSVNFFVDGDALLASCFEDELLDWKHGGQPLHVFYRFQRFVGNLLDRRAHRFHLLFFSDAEQCYSGSKLLIRQSLLRYFKATTDLHVVDDIPSIHSPAYTDLFNVQQPAFVISKKDFADVDGIDPQLALFCQSFLLLSLNSNNSGMLLDDVEFEGPKMNAWTLLERPADDLSLKLVADAGKKFDTPRSIPEPPALPKFTGRVAIAMEAVKSVLSGSTDQTTIDQCKIFITHVVLLEKFAPSARSAPLPSELPKFPALDRMREFLSSLWPAYSQAIRGFQVGDVMSEAALCDLWDGRFLVRLAIAARANLDLGLDTESQNVLDAAFQTCGLSGPLFHDNPADEISVCAECLKSLQEAAASASSFESDEVPIPSMPSSFLDQVAPESVKLYGGRAAGIPAAATGADSSSQTSTKGESVAAKKDADEEPENWDDDDDDDDAPDDWDADSDDDENEDGTGVDNGADVAVVDVKSDTTGATEVDAKLKAGDEVVLSNIAPAWSATVPLDDEGDAFNTQIVMRHVTYDGDQMRALNALKAFVKKLRRRQRGRLSERELEDAFKTMISELEESQQVFCANDLKDFYKKNRFGGGLEKIIVRKWQGKMKPQRGEQSTLVAIRDFAKSLVDRVIQTEIIVETDESAAENKTSVKSAVMSARESVKKTVTLSTKRKGDLDDVLEKVKSDTKRGRFADAWLKLDDFLLDRCVKDKVQFNLTNKAINNLKVRTADQKGGKGGAGKKGGKKGGKGGKKGGEEVDEMAELMKLYDEGMKTLAGHNVIVVARAARANVSFSWWLEQYATSEVVKAASLPESELDGLMADALDNELWACGQVVAEVFKVHSIAVQAQKYDLPLASALSNYIARLGFQKEARQMLDEANPTDEAIQLLEGAAIPIDRRGRTLYDFQMARMGPLLLRPKGSPDPRVKRFSPDSWQKKLLDLVDETGQWRRKCRDLVKARRGLTWRQASDMVEKNHNIAAQSILVSAPTSSGKTFISFYAMEQILRESSLGEGVVVYVSPTKALVNQVEADLYARYDKSFTKKSQARSMHGVFTKEYRHNVSDCQVLVTIPACLEIIMMDPLYSKLASRIRWVIFDEVHCISKEGGVIWERLLISTQATFIALSATIGNPDDFASWLQRLEESKGHKLTKVQIDSRINDLSINIYDSFASGENIVRESDRIVPINPLGVLTVQLINNYGGVPNQTKLLPEHCWEIIHAVKQLTADSEDGKLQKMVEELDLQKKVAAKAISMAESTAIERDIKQLVTYLVVHHENTAEALINNLGGKAAGIMKAQDEACQTGQMEYLETHLLSCLKSLDAAGLGSEDDNSLKRLPAIVFHLSVRGCSRIVQQLLMSLEDLQAAAQARNFCKIVLPEYNVKCEQEKLVGIESDIVYRIRATDVDESTVADEETRKAVEMSKQNQSVTCAQLREFLEVDQQTDWTKPINTEVKVLFKRIVAAKVKYYEAVISKCKQENERRVKDYEDEVKADPSGEEYHVPPVHVNFDHLLPEFIDKTYSFLPAGQPMTEDDLKEHLGRWYDSADYKTRALQRGIGLHFPELPRKYKNAVERLFRLKKLRVVVATSTLALGINMPCKTAVIAGDEPHLNALEFHQMIGRAGRRTFDNRGNVVFIGTPSRKIARLLSSNVADLVGNIPLTPGLALRLFLRYRSGHSKEDKDNVAAMAHRIVSMPFFSVGDSSVQTDQLLFCLDFLMHRNMHMLHLNRTGTDVEPSGPCMMAAHLYFLEPYNFIVVSLLQRGVFDRLVQGFVASPDASDLEKETTLDKRNQALLQLFAYLLHPKVLPQKMRGCESTANSEVRLKELPADIKSEILAYNNFVLERFSLYMRRYATVRDDKLGPADVLPGAREEVKGLFAQTPISAKDGSVIDALQKTSMTVKARTPFVALSGHNDRFSSLSDLIGSLRTGMYLDRCLVPMLPEIDRPCNSYLIDFFATGERIPLSQKNGLRDYRLYDDLNQVSHAIRVMKDMTERRLGDDATADVRLTTMEAFDTLESSFTQIFKDGFAF